MAHVARGVGSVQGPEVKTRDHALRKLFKFRPREHVAQLWLPNQDDLQKLALVGFQVGEQTQLLQHISGQTLGFVDHQNVVFTRSVGAQQIGVQRVHLRLDASAHYHHGKLIAHRLQKLGRRELGVEDVGDVVVRRHLLQKGAAHRGFASTNLAR